MNNVYNGSMLWQQHTRIESWTCTLFWTEWVSYNHQRYFSDNAFLYPQGMITLPYPVGVNVFVE